jgi:DNA-binding transcriptional ArsR family regulator
MNKLSGSAQLDTLFGALSHHKRRDIVRLLALYPATVKQLADEHNMSLPAIHKHIRVLEQARLITRRKVGRVNFVALQRSSLNVVRDWALQYRTDWGNDKETLENYIASMRE